jgi:DGQHR domain-containing protein
MRVKAFRINQRGGKEGVGIYISTMAALDLIDRYAMDRWTTENPGGYQRVPEERRFTERRGSIVRYLIKEMGCFPTSILLNVRGELTYEEDEDFGWCSLGELDIGEERLWLIDGQHRVEGLKRAIERNAEFEKYPVVVSILQLPERFDELMLFYIVNRRQRGVPTELAYRHLQRMLWEKGTDWLYDLEGKIGVQRGLAAEVVDYLSEEPASPWYGRIQRVAEPRDEAHILRDKTMIRSVVEILKNDVFEGMKVKELADLLIDYWNAFSHVYPGAFEEPYRYTVLETPGLFSLHRLFPNIYGLCTRKGLVTMDAMERHLRLLMVETPDHPEPDFRGPITLDFWTKEHGPLIALSTNMKIIADLHRHLLEKIKLAQGG